MIMASWGPKNFEVTGRKITAMSDFSTGRKLKTETNNDTEGSSATNTRGMELQEISCTVQLSAGAGANVRAECENWESLVGKYYPFMVGGRRVGPRYMQLIEASQNNVTTTMRGTYTYAEMQLSFTEYAGEAAGSKSGSTKTSSTAKASTADKSSKKARTI